jgi:hypothetical protein
VPSIFESPRRAFFERYHQPYIQPALAAGAHRVGKVIDLGSATGLCGDEFQKP